MGTWKIILTTLTLSLLSTSALGHGGGLNSYGCHRQTSTNTYHCHSGVLDGRAFSTEQGMIDAFTAASGGNTNQPPPPTSTTPTDYNRDDYLTSWRDNDNNCRDTREEVLAIESLIPPTFSSNGCDVVAGLWSDPYTNQTFTNPSDLDIDHMVPLAEAHASGAWAWPAERKSGYANDLLNAKSLIAVSASANRSKGSRGPAEWLPPNTDYHCEYVKNWSEVKRRHGLEMDVTEVATIESIIGADISFAARAESVGWNESLGQTSSAVFGLGLRKTNQCAYTRQAGSLDNIEISISVLPDPAHINQSFQIYLVAELPGGLFSLNALGQFVPFTGEISSLAPFKGNVLLRESYEFTAFSGVLNDALTFNLFIGYLASGGSFVYTAAPLPLSIIR